jgi:hypothetical protein
LATICPLGSATPAERRSRIHSASGMGWVRPERMAEAELPGMPLVSTRPQRHASTKSALALSRIRPGSRSGWKGPQRGAGIKASTMGIGRTFQSMVVSLRPRILIARSRSRLATHATASLASIQTYLVIVPAPAAPEGVARSRRCGRLVGCPLSSRSGRQPVRTPSGVTLFS